MAAFADARHDVLESPQNSGPGSMRVEDYFPKGKRRWVRLHEKGGKRQP
jgi:hypothetical protein